MSDDPDRDEELLDELRALMERVDPPPAEVTEFAKAALGLRRLDAELAELLADSVLDQEAAGAIRSAEAARRLTFRAGDLSIDIEVHSDGAARRILGQLVPAPAGGVVEVQAGSGEVVASADCDSLGRFRLTLVSGGRVRLRIRSDPPAKPVETSWLSL